MVERDVWLENGGNEGVQIGCNRIVPNLIQTKEAAAIMDLQRVVQRGGEEAV